MAPLMSSPGTANSTVVGLVTRSASGRVNGDVGIDAGDPHRRSHDTQAITHALGGTAIGGRALSQTRATRAPPAGGSCATSLPASSHRYESRHANSTTPRDSYGEVSLVLLLVVARGRHNFGRSSRFGDDRSEQAWGADLEAQVSDVDDDGLGALDRLRRSWRLNDAAPAGLNGFGPQAVRREEVDLGLVLHEPDDSVRRLFGTEAVVDQRVRTW